MNMSLPSWLKPVHVYVKRHVRNKGDFLVDEVQLKELNFAHVCVRFTTVGKLLFPYEIWLHVVENKMWELTFLTQRHTLKANL